MACAIRIALPTECLGNLALIPGMGPVFARTRFFVEGVLFVATDVYLPWFVPDNLRDTFADSTLLFGRKVSGLSLAIKHNCALGT